MSHLADPEDQGAAVSVATLGLHDEATLAYSLPGWRLRLREPLLKNLQRELPYLVWIQVRCKGLPAHIGHDRV